MIPGTDACCILLYGDIGEYDDNVRSGDIARELLEAEALTGKVDVRINSNGGEVYSGIAIFNALKNSKADITIYVDGIAASMASVIALCGKPVQMSRYARLMLHSVQGGCYGNKDEMKDCIREIEALEDTLCEMYATRMGKDKEEIRAMYFDGKDHWLRADEALALGLIDGIYDADPVPEDSTPEQVFQIFNNRLHKPQNENSMNLDELKRRPRFDAATRPIYENLLAKDRENGEKALEKLSPKRSVMTDLRVNPTGESPWNKRMSEIKDKLNHK